MVMGSKDDSVGALCRVGDAQHNNADGGSVAVCAKIKAKRAFLMDFFCARRDAFVRRRRAKWLISAQVVVLHCEGLAKPTSRTTSRAEFGLSRAVSLEAVDV